MSGLDGAAAMDGVLRIALIKYTNGRSELEQPGKFRYIFEKGTLGHGQIGKIFADYANNPKWDAFRIGGYSFEEKKLMPLQAADLMAYEVYKQMSNQVITWKHPMRRSLALLLAGQDTRHLEFYNAERLMKLVNAVRELDKQGKLG
jgi:hypothetical protein